MANPRKLGKVPRDAVVLRPSEPLEHMLSHLPAAFLVDGIPARYISSLIDVDEMAIAYLSDARSSSTTLWDLFEEFSDELPEQKLTKRGRPTKKAERIIAKWGRRAAEEFGPSGFSGSPALWVSWLLQNHADYSDALADQFYARIPGPLEPGQVWKDGELLGVTLWE